MRTSPPRSGCAINVAVEAFGDQWTLVVLRDMIFGGKRYFRELLTGSEEGIASNVLADRLARLVGAGLLTRAEARRGQRVQYTLTEPAIQLVPVLAALGSWGLRHRDTTPRLAARARLLEEGGSEFWERLMDELRVAHLGSPDPHPERASAIAALREAVASVRD
jgi:DNA-binding HxlR family transcriptional regulator